MLCVLNELGWASGALCDLGQGTDLSLQLTAGIRG